MASDDDEPFACGGPMPDHLRAYPVPWDRPDLVTATGRRDPPLHLGPHGKIRVGDRAVEPNAKTFVGKRRFEGPLEGTVTRLYGWPGMGWGEITTEDGKRFRVRLDGLVPISTAREEGR